MGHFDEEAPFSSSLASSFTHTYERGFPYHSGSTGQVSIDFSLEEMEEVSEEEMLG